MASKAITSPGSGKVLQLNHETIDYDYVKFPDDVTFIGSIAHNSKLDGKAFVPVLRDINGKKETHLYGFHTTGLTAQHLAGPIKAPDGSKDVTIFGSHVDKKGMLYLCCWNRNSILVLDTKQVVGKADAVFCEAEYEDILKPKDVTTDPRNEKILYVAGSTSRNTPSGIVYKIELDQAGGSEYETSIQADGFSTLSGIKVVNKEIWLCQMYDIVAQDTKRSALPAVQQWKGNDGKGNVWLANCINAFDTKYALCPAYKVVPEDIVDSMRSPTSGSGLGSIFCCCKKDVSKALSLTHNDESEEGGPVRLMFIDTQNVSKSVHMEIFLAERDEKFSSNGITHVQHVVDAKKRKGVIACINFEQPRILVMKDKAFHDIIKKETQTKSTTTLKKKPTTKKKIPKKKMPKTSLNDDYI